LRQIHTAIITSANQNKYFVISKQPHRALKHSRSIPEQGLPDIETKQITIKTGEWKNFSGEI
jgi:hypothetical protein